jgi:MEMO1 family protein
MRVTRLLSRLAPRSPLHLCLHRTIMAGNQIIREDSHAGSWYTASGPQLNAQLDGWLAAVQAPIKCIGPRSEDQTVPELPVPGARVIIAP